MLLYIYQNQGKVKCIFSYSAVGGTREVTALRSHAVRFRVRIVLNFYAQEWVMTLARRSDEYMCDIERYQ